MLKGTTVRKNDILMQSGKSVDLTPYTDTSERKICSKNRLLSPRSFYPHWTLFCFCIQEWSFCKYKRYWFAIVHDMSLSCPKVISFYFVTEKSPCSLCTQFLFCNALAIKRGFFHRWRHWISFASKNITVTREGIRDGKTLNDETHAALKCKIAQTSRFLNVRCSRQVC